MYVRGKSNFMKLILTVLSVLLCSTILGQNSTGLTPQGINKLKLDIEKEVLVEKKRLEMAKVNNVQAEFMLDTFRIQRLMDKYIELDATDLGMREATYLSVEMYDSLLNKYYKKLLTTLKAEDKQVLVKAQRAWVIFRDAESKLVYTISKDSYSGGGTIQRLTEATEYFELFRSRTLSIFDHYLRATQNY